jgi:hypothetical protein
MKINRDNKVQHLDDTSFKPDVLKGKKVIATGTLNHFSRKGIEETVIKLGGKYASSVSTSLDFVIAGANAGSKLQNAREIGVLVIEERQFIYMITGKDIPQLEDINMGGLIDIAISGYGHIVEFKLIHEKDLNKIQLAMNNLDGFDPQFSMIELEEEIYNKLIGTEYEISNDYDDGYSMSVFGRGYHELTIVDSEDDENMISLEDEAEGLTPHEVIVDASVLLSDYIKGKVAIKKYSHIILIATEGHISDYEENIPVKSKTNFKEIDPKRIEFVGQRRLKIEDFEVELSGDNWDLNNGKDMFVLVLKISRFLKIETEDNFDYEEHIFEKDEIRVSSATNNLKIKSEFLEILKENNKLNDYFNYHGNRHIKKAFKKLPETLLYDKDFVIKAVGLRGWLLEVLTENFRSDVEVVLTAVKQYGRALAFASESLRSNKDIVLSAIGENYTAKEFASADLQEDKDVIQKAKDKYEESTAWIRNSKML